MWRRLRDLFRRRRLDRDLEIELGHHFDALTAEYETRGFTPEDARFAARRDLGGLIQVREAYRDQHGIPVVETFWQDVRYALRTFRRSPGFAAVAILTLALGIGANSAMFALADATLMRPLPFAQADRLVMVWERSPRAPRSQTSALNLRDWIERNRTFDDMAAVGAGLGGGPLLEGRDGTVESVERQSVSTRFFDVLGVTPVAGRTFLPADEGPASRVVVISEGLWRSRFGSDATLIGRDIRLNGQPHTVVGVVPDEIRFTRPARVWTLLPRLSANDTLNQRGLRFLEVVGRMKQGVTLDEATADLTVIATQLAQESPASNKDWSVTIEPLRTGLVGRELQLTSLFLLGVVGFVLLICCVNVATLLLARASTRARELAVRSALGGGRARIVRQLVTESLVLAAIGGVFGVAVGVAILKSAPALMPAGLLPAAVTLSFDRRVLIFCGTATFVVGVLFGLMPAWQATSTALVQALASQSRSVTRGGGPVRNLLAGAQVAAAVLLLCGAGLLLRTLFVLGSFETGYRVPGDSVLTLDFTLGGPRYRTAEANLQFYDAVERDVRALPDVRSVGWASTLPWGATELGRWPFEIVGDPPVEEANRPRADYSIASPGYFDTLDLPIVAGRGFTDHDAATSTPVCLVNEEFVRRHLQARDPIGVRITMRPSVMSSAIPATREIVGVVRQVKGRPDEAQPIVQVYVPLRQTPWSDVFLVVQPAAGRSEALVGPIRSAAARVDPNVPIRRSRTLDDLADEATSRYRFRAVMVGTFAALALLLAMIGVFSVLAYSVEQRSREFGVRIALGASTRSVLRLVLASAARLVVAGAVTGLALAAALAQSIAAFLFGVRPLDPATYAAVAVVLAVTAALAVTAPVLRAARVDPVVTFRNDV